MPIVAAIIGVATAATTGNQIASLTCENIGSKRPNRLSAQAAAIASSVLPVAVPHPSRVVRRRGRSPRMRPARPRRELEASKRKRRLRHAGGRPHGSYLLGKECGAKAQQGRGDVGSGDQQPGPMRVSCSSRDISRILCRFEKRSNTLPDGQLIDDL